MKIIYSKKILSQQLNELEDLVDKETVENINEYNSNNVDNVDYEALGRGEIPVELMGDDVGGILADNQEAELEQEFPLSEEDVQQEATIEDVPDSSKNSVEEAMSWAIENNRVVKIFYTTKGENRGRGGKQYLKRETGLERGRHGGVNIYRIIEPHEIFKADNGNRILVTYDRSVRHIRAFILDNITDYNFTQNRVTKEPQHFKKRDRVMPKHGKGIKVMKNTNSKIMKVAKELEDKGMSKSAAIVRDAQKALEELKTAQYVGAQGYAIRNRRCWDNCYRQKRTSNPEKAAQVVWTECWDEYKKSINNDSSGWEKYALDKTQLKFSSINQKNWKKEFATIVSEKIKTGLTTPEAVYATIEESSQKYYDDILDKSVRIAELAETMKENKMEDLGEKLAGLSSDLVREAGLWQGIKNVGKGIKDMWNKGEDPEKKNDDPETMKQRLSIFLKNVRQLAQKIRNNIRYNPKSSTTAGSGEKIIIEAGKGSRKEAQLGTVSPRKIQPKRFDPEQYAQEKRDEGLAYDQSQKEKEQDAINANIDSDRDGWNDAVDVDANGNNVADVKEQSDIKQAPQKTNPDSVNTIKQVNNLTYEADEIASWIMTEAPIDPQEQEMASKVVGSLQQSANEIRGHLTSGDLNNENVATKLEQMGQAVTQALQMVGPSVGKDLQDAPQNAPQNAPQDAPPDAPQGNPQVSQQNAPFQGNQSAPYKNAPAGSGLTVAETLKQSGPAVKKQVDSIVNNKEVAGGIGWLVAAFDNYGVPFTYKNFNEFYNAWTGKK